MGREGGCVEWLFAEDAEDAEGDVVVIAIYPRVVSDAQHICKSSLRIYGEMLHPMALIFVMYFGHHMSNPSSSPRGAVRAGSLLQFL